MDYLNINKQAWNERAIVHFDSSFYDVPSFLAGNSSLTEIETAELTDVAGKSLLHLQCHFGLDTLSWARLGASVTGVDLSDEAIDKARELATQCNIEAEFVCADVYEFANKRSKSFDIVFTSFGAICWLPCLTKWAQVISDSLNQGGTFYMAEFHPVQDVLDGYPYFHQAEPDVVVEGSYTQAGNNSDHEQTMVTWAHSLSEVINALIQAGIRIDAVNEFPFSPYNCFENLIEKQPKQFQSIVKGQPIPLVFSIKGTKC
ncbi:class I SAM-dependent methyltransferase [Shewanella sp. 1_MG-2023]|uniref:class I SAM-dependent methyltransferase n=1 Tax=unclassified Shewanella TaxID=196818 RepID=UPI001E516644|nr:MULTISPECIES: class I SAM-dependent methyltransferase [unclassified Shewanella]MCC4832117.1 class I SAM-dependent methyltransferase [Shewanella sp. 10N.7]MDO6611684.1 class I SAM-dependent methyltransferase [Shewanella sp. 7_MG-2023]MDO6771539.1 class I SAM-dependent methyltransferase [Shewanella sp. 2_MG-2023]MDO6793812.1 class I SAM-dependent methyltransferase [Shewanella sp. 1_MG-2023]